MPPTPIQPLPTGITRIPVCIGDLPNSDYKVTVDTTTFDVVKVMRDDEGIPGVMIFRGNKLVSAIPRLRLFERLGQLYGVDLFIRKPIHVLQENIHSEAFELFDFIRINDAVQLALGRPPHTVYDPIIAVSENGGRRLLDMHTLLIAQSQIITNTQNVVTSLDRVARTLSKGANFLENLYYAINTLGQNVPYHGAAIFLHQNHILELIAGSGFYHAPSRSESDKKIIQSTTYKTMLHVRHAIAIDDVDMVPDWEYMSDLGKMRCWLGVPLYTGHKFFGLISIARQSRTPFRKDELDIAEAFARHISKALEEEYITGRNACTPNGINVEAITLLKKGNNFIV